MAAGSAASAQMLAKAKRIRSTLDLLYPNPPATFLPAANHYELLIKVLLSAQSTDVRVNKHAPDIFSKFGSTPELLLERATQPELEEVIRPIGLAPRKSRNILALSQILIDKHESKVPDTLELLEELPGVGHKTASVVLLHAFDKPAFPVDTHIHRLGCRWGLGDAKSVERTEAAFKAWFPEEHLWGRLHVQLIMFGREHCPATKHVMEDCPICKWAATREAFAANRKSPGKFVAAVKHSSPSSIRTLWEEAGSMHDETDENYDFVGNVKATVEEGKTKAEDEMEIKDQAKAEDEMELKDQAKHGSDIARKLDFEAKQDDEALETKPKKRSRSRQETKPDFTNGDRPVLRRSSRRKNKP